MKGCIIHRELDLRPTWPGCTSIAGGKIIASETGDNGEE